MCVLCQAWIDIQKKTIKDDDFKKYNHYKQILNEDISSDVKSKAEKEMYQLEAEKS